MSINVSSVLLFKNRCSVVQYRQEKFTKKLPLESLKRMVCGMSVFLEKGLGGMLYVKIDHIRDGIAKVKSIKRCSWNEEIQRWVLPNTRETLQQIFKEFPNEDIVV